MSDNIKTIRLEIYTKLDLPKDHNLEQIKDSLTVELKTPNGEKITAKIEAVLLLEGL